MKISVFRAFGSVFYSIPRLKQYLMEKQISHILCLFVELLVSIICSDIILILFSERTHFTVSFINVVALVISSL